MDFVIEMLGIRKEFSGFVANDNITLQLKQGEIHALLGENGAGKSTLMNVLFGLYEPDGGEIRVRGTKENINSPNKANELGIGMVHQHFMLVDNSRLQKTSSLVKSQANSVLSKRKKRLKKLKKFLTVTACE